MEITVAFSRFFKNIRFNWLKMKYQINVLQFLLSRIHNFLANYGAIFVIIPYCAFELMKENS